MRRVMPLALAVVIIAGCSGSNGSGGPGNAPGPGGNATPQNAGDFSYNPPEGLKQQDKQLKGNTVFLGPKEDGFQTSLLVKSGIKATIKAEQFGKATVDKLVTKDGATVKEQEPFKAPGSDAYTWLISRKNKAGLLIDQRQFVIIKNNVGVLFTLTAAEGAMSKWDQALADSLQDFKWGR